MRTDVCAFIICNVLIIVLAGCLVQQPAIAVGDTVRYRVNGAQGEGVVVAVLQRFENGKECIYYKVDIGTDSLGRRDIVNLHHALVDPYKPE